MIAIDRPIWDSYNCSFCPSCAFHFNSPIIGRFCQLASPGEEDNIRLMTRCPKQSPGEGEATR